MIAINIIFAAIVFTGLVGFLAFNIVKSRTATATKAIPATAKSRPTARRRAYGSWESINA